MATSSSGTLTQAKNATAAAVAAAIAQACQGDVQAASQALATKNPQLKAHFLAASAEETDHLAWTEARLNDLGARPSLLNPLWYAGAFGLGFIAGKLGGDAVSLSSSAARAAVSAGGSSSTGMTTSTQRLLRSEVLGWRVGEWVVVRVVRACFAAAARMQRALDAARRFRRRFRR